MTERNVNMKPGDILKIKYNGYIMKISSGANNSIFLEGLRDIGFNDMSATYITVPNIISARFIEKTAKRMKTNGESKYY